jgi:ubiquinone/menaquinone biosynthesis C-methylase UbiE
MTEGVSARMREDWNARAREDANYYVAFGRREQSEEEFFATAAEVVAGIEWELKHLGPATSPRTRRALEIGCGPGRLMKPLSRNFGEIHGVDVSDEMIRLARERLSGVPHAHVHATSGAELAQFGDESFDLVYSYAVFQHIPSRDVVLQYLRETHRVLKPNGLVRMQFNGLPQDAPSYDTWAGVRFSAAELVDFTREYDFQVLALEGASTQYMWTTWRKRHRGWRTQARARRAAVEAGARIRRVTNAHNSEPVAPNRGRFASISVWIENLPNEVDLFDLEVRTGGIPARGTYIGPPDATRAQQVNAVLAESDNTGLLPVELLWFGRPVCEPGYLRLIPSGPQVPRIVSISDGINLLAGTRIETGSLKVTLEEVACPDQFAATVDGQPVQGQDIFCTDPLPRRYEVNFHLPEGTGPGRHTLEIRLGRRRFAPVGIEVASGPPASR